MDKHKYPIQDANYYKKNILKEAEFLCDMSPGTVWTEYHWRGVAQLLVNARDLFENFNIRKKK